MLSANGAYGALEYDPAILYGSEYITDFPVARDIAACNSAITLFGSLFSAVSSQKHRLQVRTILLSVRAMVLAGLVVIWCHRIILSSTLSPDILIPPQALARLLIAPVVCLSLVLHVQLMEYFATSIKACKPGSRRTAILTNVMASILDSLKGSTRFWPVLLFLRLPLLSMFAHT